MQNIEKTSKETDVSKEASERSPASDINSIRENSEKSNPYEKNILLQMCRITIDVLHGIASVQCKGTALPCLRQP